MGRSDVLVLGGRGFVGSAVVEQLGSRAVTFDQKPGEKQHRQGSILSVDDLAAAMKGVSSVINLIGLTPTRQPRIPYEKIHVEGVKNVLTACKRAKVKRLIHMSALGADPNSPLAYLRTKGEGEALVKRAKIKTTIFKPSLIYDRGNELIQMMHQLSSLRCFPNIPARVQPVYRGDIAQLFTRAVAGKIKEQVLEVGGPEQLTIFDMAKTYFAARRRACLPIPFPLVKAAMLLGSLLGVGGIGREQIAYLTKENTTTTGQNYCQLLSFSDWVHHEI